MALRFRKLHAGARPEQNEGSPGDYSGLRLLQCVDVQKRHMVGHVDLEFVCGSGTGTSRQRAASLPELAASRRQPAKPKVLRA